ncbi:unnamed protein product, partial [Closterium sp. NIES-64]
MSSLRNVVKRKAHKERAQPVARRRLGLLEKHKDYVLRAKDFHRKEDAIRTMREKAAMRNPDEFYFKMEHSRLNRGRHVRVEKEEWTEEEVRLMNSQDMGYIRTKWQAEQQVSHTMPHRTCAAACHACALCATCAACLYAMCHGCQLYTCTNVRFPSLSWPFPLCVS